MFSAALPRELAQAKPLTKVPIRRSTALITAQFRQMGRILMFGAYCFTTGLPLANTTVAQTSADWLQVSGPVATCLNQRALAKRTQQYLQGRTPRGVKAHVQATQRQAQFSLVRGRKVIARRRFDRLPKDCQTQRNTVALVLALALESTGAAQTRKRTASTLTASTKTSGQRSTATNRSKQPPIRSNTVGADSAKEPTTAEPEPEKTLSFSDTAQVPLLVDSDANSLAANPKNLTPVTQGAKNSASRQSNTSEEVGTHRVPLTWAAFAGFGILLEPQPTAAPLLHAGAALKAGPFSLGIAALWSPEVETQATSGDSIRTSLLGSRATACLGTNLGALYGEGCLGILAGALTATGNTFDENQRATVAWMASEVGVAARFPQNFPMTLGVRLSTHQNLLRPELVVIGSEDERSRARFIGFSASAEVQWTPQ